VKRLPAKLLTIRFALLVLACCVAGGLSPVCLAQQTDPSGKQSWSESLSSGVKRGFDKIGGALNPKPPLPPPSPEDDAISLAKKSKPSANLYVAVGRLYAQADKLGEAEQQYLLALNAKRDFLPALLAYAELKERMGEPDNAIQIYQRAAAVYPHESAVYNNMGLCFARQGRLDDAASALNRAVQMSPKNVRYRNNIATVLVDRGSVREAFEQLRQVHGEAAAYYNVAYLLNKKGQTQAAIQHFAQALRADPSMVAAKNWMNYLERTTTQARLPQHPAAEGLRIIRDNSVSDGPRDAIASPSDSLSARPEQTPQQQAAAPPEREPPSLPEAPMPQTPRRLPPVSSAEPEPSGPTLPGISDSGSERPAAPAAPLPPPSSNSAVRHLPRVN
jgi:tetratricopeptide (TPR) repeat protein